MFVFFERDRDLDRTMDEAVDVETGLAFRGKFICKNVGCSDTKRFLYKSPALRFRLASTNHRRSPAIELP